MIVPGVEFFNTLINELDPDAKSLSYNVSLSKEYYPLADRYQTANPIIVQRKAVGKLPVYAEYFYTPQDSLLHLVSYDWEMARYADLKEVLESRKEQSGKLEIYLGEYVCIREQLIKTFGKPNQVDEKPKTVPFEGQSYFNQNTLWETDAVHTILVWYLGPYLSDQVNPLLEKITWCLASLPLQKPPHIFKPIIIRNGKQGLYIL